jgi:hypothetical protein
MRPKIPPLRNSRSIDRKSLDQCEIARQWLQHMLPWTYSVRRSYEQYLILEVWVQKVIAAMGTASGSVELFPG